jgi:uncharacterized membrane protein
MPHFLSNRPGASRRLEALTDGVFAIAATLLVLEIRVPDLAGITGRDQLLVALRHVGPSFLAFFFSFLNILIFWTNLDAVGQVTRYFTMRLTYLTLFFLLFISLIPFTTRFVIEYPDSLAAISTYGLVLLACSLLAMAMYHHIAFGSDMMDPGITPANRRKVWRKVLSGPLLFGAAIALGFVQVYIPVIIYALVPVLFLFMPGLGQELDPASKGRHPA